jgi:hypothetical protein
VRLEVAIVVVAAPTRPTNLFAAASIKLAAECMPRLSAAAVPLSLLALGTLAYFDVDYALSISLFALAVGLLLADSRAMAPFSAKPAAAAAPLPAAAPAANRFSSPAAAPLPVLPAFAPSALSSPAAAALSRAEALTPGDYSTTPRSIAAGATGLADARPSPAGTPSGLSQRLAASETSRLDLRWSPKSAASPAASAPAPVRLQEVRLAGAGGAGNSPVAAVRPGLRCATSGLTRRMQAKPAPVKAEEAASTRIMDQVGGLTLLPLRGQRARD